MQISDQFQKIHLAGKKITALSFAAMILIANFWFILRFTGEVFPEWSNVLFFLGVLGVMLGCLMMLPAWINPAKKHQESDEDSES